MRIKDAAKSRTISFNAIFMAGVPLFNTLFPEIAISAELATQIFGFGNLILRFLTDKPVGKIDE